MILRMEVRDRHGALMYRLAAPESELREQGVGFTSQHGPLAWTAVLFRNGVRVAACKRGVWHDAPTPVRRGTSNSNARGNTRDREIRRRWLLRTWTSDVDPGLARCYRCGVLLELHQITVDRIIPGARGGRYVRSNIRPACAKCNSETGGAVRG